MPHLHFRRDVYKSGGAKASARIEYITGRIVNEHDSADRQLRYIREDREDLVVERTRNLPAWAKNPHVYFRAAEQYEGGGDKRAYNAFEEWKITLPQEFSREQNLALVDDLIDTIAGDRLPCTYAFHDPTTLDGAHRQPHIHLLISARITDAHTRTAEQHFKRYNRDHPERSGAQKDPMMNHRGAVKAHRVLIADIVNIHLEHAGQAVRVHPDRLSARGIDRTPEPKLLPSESRQYRERGIISETMQEVLNIRTERTLQLAREQNNARHYWEGRKAELGFTRDLPMEVKLARISEARAQRIQHAPERQERTPHRGRQPTMRQRVQNLKRTVQDRQHAGRREPPVETTERLRTATQRLKDLARTLGHDDDAPAGPGLRVRLFDRERDNDHDRSMSW